MRAEKNKIRHGTLKIKGVEYNKQYYNEYMSAIKFFKEMRELNETSR